MNLIEKLSKNEIKEHFCKSWMTHDAMWYGTAMQVVGADQANYLNKTAVRLMAVIEIQRVMKLMGKPKNHKVETFSELVEIFETAFELIETSFMPFEFTVPEKNVLHGQLPSCMAYKGVKQYGMIEKYDCGIFERIKGWADALDVKWELKPDFKGCLMHQTGKCEVYWHFDLK
jgi:hypothetical protein